ncbi:MAG: sulfite exporter TauE/SafE family protein [Rhodocyclaceae bacterium]|nr:sulfite exporter TauE/SafE family protein [Rhodocyclaceae bacterium]
MPDTGFIAVFLIGLLGGVHCIGMCGGIVSALSAQPLGQPVVMAGTRPGARSAFPIHLAYNAGRISSYVMAGALVGAIGSFGMLLNGLLPVQMALYVAANLMMIALGLYLTGFTQSLAFTERVGRSLWQRIQPYTRRFLPARTPAQAYPLGLLWGWLPCGMVYGVLTAALLSGSAQRGAATMLAFGLGTLPNLLLAGMLLQRLRSIVQARYVRLGSGLLVIAFGVWGLINATSLGGKLWAGIAC